jgi:leucyl aminopeptidase (aminopeptidase T)
MRPEYAAGARNAVRTCLGIHAGDRVAVIFDRERSEIADAVTEEARAAGAGVRGWAMEDWVERPAREFPRSLADEVIAFRPTASFYIGGSRPGELAFRQPMRVLLVHQLRCRHGHMVNIAHEVMVDGMTVDYAEVHRLTNRVAEVVRSVSKIEVATRLGTELVATFSPRHRWIPCDARYWEPGMWGNLPEGEVFTAPASVDGLLVGEELGDHFDAKYGLLEEPARLRVRDGRVIAVEMDGHPEIRQEIETYLAQSPNSNRAGEFAIGTNTGLTRIIGNFLQDEKFPGVHVAFGDPYGAETGADWECPSHVDVLASRADVWVDGRQIMQDGRFLV